MTRTFAENHHDISRFLEYDMEGGQKKEYVMYAYDNDEKDRWALSRITDWFCIGILVIQLLHILICCTCTSFRNLGKASLVSTFSSVRG